MDDTRTMHMASVFQPCNFFAPSSVIGSSNGAVVRNVIVSALGWAVIAKMNVRPFASGLHSRWPSSIWSRTDLKICFESA